MNATPLGPFEACGNLVRTQRAADGTGGFLVAECPANTDNASEHATLFAGSPDLLRELQHAVRWFDQITPADVERYKAAIAKATSEVGGGNGG